MSQQKSCPFCKRIIRLQDKYCPFCGRFVIEGNQPPNVYSRVSQPAQPPSMPPPMSPPPYMPPPSYGPPPGPSPPFEPPTRPGEPGPGGKEAAPSEKEPEPLSEEVMEQIALRVELQQLDESMNDIRKKLEDLGAMVSKVEITPDIENKIKNFKEQIKEIKAKREKLNAEKRDLPFEEELTQKREIQDRLKNLNEAYRTKKVTESAFKKLRSEYEEKLTTLDNKTHLFKTKISTWIKKIKDDEKHYQEKLELIDARFAAGEMTQTQYEKDKKESEEKIKRYTNVLKFLSGKV